MCMARTHLDAYMNTLDVLIASVMLVLHTSQNPIFEILKRFWKTSKTFLSDFEDVCMKKLRQFPLWDCFYFLLTPFLSKVMPGYRVASL